MPVDTSPLMVIAWNEPAHVAGLRPKVEPVTVGMRRLPIGPERDMLFHRSRAA